MTRGEVVSRFCHKLAIMLASVIFCASVASSAQAEVDLMKVRENDAEHANIDFSSLAFDTAVNVNVSSVLLVQSRSKIAKNYVADPAVVEAYVANPKQVVLNGKAPGVTSIVLWDEAGLQRVLTVSVNLSVDLLRETLHAAFPNCDLQVEVAREKVILTGVVGSRPIADEVVKLAAQFSKNVVDSLIIDSARVPQVELKVRFIEIDRSKLSQFGINIFGPGGSSALGGASTGQFPSAVSLSNGSSGSSSGSTLSNGSALTVSNPLDLLFYSAKLGTAVTVQDLESKQLAQILAEPTLTTMSGESASRLAGGEFPFPVVQANAGSSASVTIQFRPYGVKLEVTPRVNPDRTVELKVRPEVSSLDYTNAVTISGFTIPAISTKTVDTALVLRSGQSFAISGLLNKQTIDSLSRIPGLSSVPYLGALFRSKATNLSTSELMIIVTPRIIDPLETGSAINEPTIVRPMIDSARFDKDVKTKMPTETVR